VRAIIGWTLLLLLDVPGVREPEWPTLRGDTERSGTVRTVPPGPYRRAWVRHFAGDRMGSAMEPIVADGRVYLATHRGDVMALKMETGEPLWRFHARGAFLHSPAYSGGILVAGSADGNLYGLEAASGKPRWSVSVGVGGFSASPTIGGGAVLIGSRGGEFLAADLHSGRVLWRQSFGAPIRQTAAFAEGRVYFMAEDLRVRSIELGSGRVVWTSDPLVGQTARDYYPVLVRSGGRLKVIVLTNSVVNISTRMWRDTQCIFKSAGMSVEVSQEGRGKIQAYARRDDAQGTPELWAKEQADILQYLKNDPSARSMFIFDAEGGRAAPPPPVLGVVGNGGLPTPPVVLPDGRLLVFYRSVYGNWNLGYHVLVALGLLDLEKNRIEPFFHAHGKQPPWNTFWGTADESQNFVAAENAFLVVHMDTLSRFDRSSGQLSLVAGNRDSWGGFRNLPWARNEWHGPARGGTAIVGDRLYWLTGSRIHCYVAGESGDPAADVEIDARAIPAVEAPGPLSPEDGALRERLAAAVTDAVSRRWAPLFVDPGVAWREFFFDDSSEVFEVLARAFPHLSGELKIRVQEFLAKEWEEHPPFTAQSRHGLEEGERRERFTVPTEVLSRPGFKKPPHPFGGVYSAWLYAERCGEQIRLGASWSRIKASFEEFAGLKWRLDPEKGDLYANRYLASLLAFAQMAESQRDPEAVQKAAGLAEGTTRALVAWWKRAAERTSLRAYANIKEWDEAILKGEGGLFFRLKEHNQKVALFHDLTPEVAGLVRAGAPEAVDRIWKMFSDLCPTWPLAGEEHQVHTGENFVDPPDFARDAFKAAAWLAKSSRGELADRIDVPFCRADLGTLAKIALTLDQH